ncbi:hypothetical protein O181_064225 [Austropuccinia psidii MF-1]|uniref:Uncharacterized protein n=1 Tax=Austropuccinia psidii MF-1 TaxID=1389203 RepID=A0A9Q3ESS3_9BASI|nr:hypothetical protein [Austropuccinia psidii MF-1]
MKDLSIFTDHLPKIMTSNHSSNHSASYKSCSYDSLSLPPTANIQSRSPKTTNELSLRSNQPAGSQYISTNQERTQRNKCSKSLTELAADHMENTGSEVCSGNTTVNFSLDSDLSPASKPNTIEEYNKGTKANTIEKGNNPSSNLPDANSKKIYNTKKHNLKPTTIHNSSNINKSLSKTMASTVTKINYDRISKDFSNRSPYLVTANTNTKNKNPSTRAKTTISNLNTNLTSSNTNKIELKTIDATVTENREETILSKIVN